MNTDKEAAMKRKWGRRQFIRWILCDITAAVFLLVACGYFEYEAAYTYQKVPQTVMAAEQTALCEESETNLPDAMKGIRRFARDNPDAVIEQIQSETDDAGNVSLDVYRIGQERADGKQIMYAADVYVQDVRYLQTVLAQDSYGKNVREPPLSMIARKRGILGISGDNYGEKPSGVTVRNGVWYHDEIKRREICVLYMDGTMEVISPDQYDGEALRAKGVWQVWTFGPGLLDADGNPLTDFSTVDSYLQEVHPRAAIGYVEPGHYLFFVADGRQEGYAEGLGLRDLAQVMSDFGCRAAYNLDGGKTATMMTSDGILNQPCEGAGKGGGREQSDIIYIGRMVE